MERQKVMEQKKYSQQQVSKPVDEILEIMDQLELADNPEMKRLFDNGNNFGQLPLQNLFFFLAKSKSITNTT